MSSSESEDEVEQVQFKLIILGDGAVGKTSTCMRFTDDYFSNVYKQTIGIDFFLKRLVLPGDVQVALQIWDIGGQTIGGKMLKNYIYGAHAVLFVYDITSYESFQNLEDWHRLVVRTFGNDKLPYLAVAGNKSDMTHSRAVTKEQNDRFVDENDMHSYYFSAKTGDKVNATFFEIAANLSGIDITRNELDAEMTVVEAPIINHQQNDPEVKAPDKNKGNRGCTVQ